MKLVLPGFHRQIVNIEVTVETVGEHPELSFGMGRLVAFGTGRDLGMLAVATGAVDLGVFAGRFLPLPEYLAVAILANDRFSRRSKADFFGRMHRVAFGTGSQRLLREMRFMALEARGDVTVPVIMADRTRLLGVLARKLLKLAGRSGVTVGAGRFELRECRSSQRGMGVDMAG